MSTLGHAPICGDCGASLGWDREGPCATAGCSGHVDWEATAVALMDAVAETRREERQRIVERLLHAANLLDSDEVSRTALTLERMAMVLVTEGEDRTEAMG